MDESARQEVVVAWPIDERRGLLGGERASFHLRKGESGLAQLVELGKVSAGLDDVDLGVGADILEAELVPVEAGDFTRKPEKVSWRRPAACSSPARPRGERYTPSRPRRARPSSSAELPQPVKIRPLDAG